MGPEARRPVRLSKLRQLRPAIKIAREPLRQPLSFRVELVHEMRVAGISSKLRFYLGLSSLGLFYTLLKLGQFFLLFERELTPGRRRLRPLLFHGSFLSFRLIGNGLSLLPLSSFEKG